MKVKHPNGSVETWSEHPKLLLHIQAPNAFGTSWGINFDSRIHNQRTGNPDAQGVHRRGRKWYLDFDKATGWRWV